MGEAQTIVRYGPPSNLDKHPYGTRVVVYKNSEDTLYDLWIQLSNHDEPNWEYMGEFRKDHKSTVEVYLVEPD